jgi:N-hydroxyarylamine O-acetyltransferase
MCIMRNETLPISIDNLINKLLVKKEGGVCYELNALLYLFLIENRFDAVLTTGVVYKNDTQTYPTLGRTHVSILLTHEEQTYVLDTGFGGNLPLTPVPLTGETVRSANGQFRIQKMASEHGDYVFEHKLKHKHTEWKKGYVLDSGLTITKRPSGPTS